MREIVKFPSKVLRMKTNKIKMVDDKLLEEINELREILEAAENGAGLAAPQIGISKAFLGIKGQDGVKILINPKLVRVFGGKVYPKMVENGVESDFLEGCLSFPDLYGTVKRFLKIEVLWEELVEGKLKKKKVILEGFEAIVWQHEVDHLNGILFVDHVDEEGGKFFLWEGKDKIKMDVRMILDKEK
ncbi:peptide deformylase [Patescibacteria group bacterium]|nr:peptide deformylase [Patescibacteria group bacterium]